MSRKYAILGETLKHTMSPPIHARLFELKGREFEYEILEVKPEELKDKIRTYRTFRIPRCSEKKRYSNRWY